jgi:hypothetical protein
MKLTVFIKLNVPAVMAKLNILLKIMIGDKQENA